MPRTATVLSSVTTCSTAVFAISATNCGTNQCYIPTLIAKSFINNRVIPVTNTIFPSLGFNKLILRVFTSKSLSGSFGYDYLCQYYLSIFLVGTYSIPINMKYLGILPIGLLCL